MPQNDMVIENAGPLSVRQQIQLALQAAVSNNSGSGEPATTYAFMSWADEANDLLKLRNADNTGWVSFAVLSTGKPVGTDVVQAPARNCVLNKESITQGTVTKAGFETVLGTAASTIDDTMFLIWGKDRNNATGHQISSSVMPNKYLKTDSYGAAVNSAPPAIDADDITLKWSLTHSFSGTTNHGKSYTCHYNPHTGQSVILLEGSGEEGHKIPSHLASKVELATIKRTGVSERWVVHHESQQPIGYLELHTNVAVNTAATVNTVIHAEDGIVLGSGNSVNALNSEYLIILQHSVEGFSKIGTYNPSGQVGFEVDCGFPSGHTIIKSTSTANWIIGNVMLGSQIMFPDLPDGSEDNGSVKEVQQTATGFRLTGSHVATNGLGSPCVYTSYAASSTDATHSQANYQEPTTPDTLSISEGSLVTFADGFNGVGAVDTAVTVGTGITYQLPAGNEGKTVFIYMNGDGTIGCTQVPFAVGRSRPAADTWGVQSDNDFRTTTVHSEAQSVTGVFTPSSEYVSATDYDAYNAFAGRTGSGSEIQTWLTVAGSYAGGVATDARGYEYMRYAFSESRVLEEVVLRATGHASSHASAFPKNWKAFGIVDGIATEVLDVVGDSSGGASLLNPARFIGSVSAYDEIEVRFYTNNGHSYLGLQEIVINTSAPKGDFYSVSEGVAYDANDTPIKRVCLAEVDVDSNGGAVSIRNYPVAKSNVMGMTVHGLLELTENVIEVPFGVVQKGNKRYFDDNPFGKENWKGCSAIAYVLIEGDWVHVPLTTHATGNVSWGVEAHVSNKGLSVRTGSEWLNHGYDSYNVSSHESKTAIASAKCVVLVTFNGRAKNA